MNTLAFSYILPTTGRIPDFHRLETCAAGRTEKRTYGNLIWIPYVLLRYCSHGCVPRGIFVRIKHETPELYGAKLRFLQFPCIAERAIVRSTPDIPY